MESIDDKSTPIKNTTKDRLIIPPTPNLNLLGYGTGVNVWSLNKTSTSSPWAVKSVRKFMGKNHQKHLQELIDKESLILSDIQHENIIGYRGILQAQDGRRCLAMETCGRSLGDLVEERFGDGIPFTAEQITAVVISTAKALHYLHSEKRILHGDVKSYNILIKGDFELIKLCDFGVCEKLNDDGEALNYHGTQVYNAPEVLDEESEEPITGKAEIFSLGLVMWEMMALQVPCPGLYDDSSNSATDINPLDISIEEELDKLTSSFGVRLPPPPGLDSSYHFILKVYNLCTEPNPKNRPSALEVVNMLSQTS